MNRLQISGKKTVALAGAMLLCGSMGWAQTRPSDSPTGQVPGQSPTMDSQMNQMQMAGQPSSMDRLFVKNAIEGSMAEIQLAKLTLQKSDNEQVKQFAQKMIDDHTKMQDQMKPVAQQFGVSIPDQVSKKDRKTMAKLEGLSGSAYDQAYISNMVKDHRQDLSEFQREASSGQDQTVKDAANQGSKVIAQHLQLAEQMAKDQNVTVTGQ